MESRVFKLLQSANDWWNLVFSNLNYTIFLSNLASLLTSLLTLFNPYQSAYTNTILLRLLLFFALTIMSSMQFPSNKSHVLLSSTLLLHSTLLTTLSHTSTLHLVRHHWHCTQLVHPLSYFSFLHTPRICFFGAISKHSYSYNAFSTFIVQKFFVYYFLTFKGSTCMYFCVLVSR
jgi:hypothetical protein